MPTPSLFLSQSGLGGSGMNDAIISNFHAVGNHNKKETKKWDRVGKTLK